MAYKTSKKMSSSSEASIAATHTALNAIFASASSSTLVAMESGICKILESKRVSSRLHKGIRPYLHTAGFVDLIGKEINEENLRDIVGALGVKPSKEMIEAVLSTGVKSHVLYINTFYLLLANGKEIDDASMSAVIKALGMKPDHNRIKEVIAICKKQL